MRLSGFRKGKEKPEEDHEDISTKQWKKLHEKYKSDFIYHRVLSKSQRTGMPVMVQGAATGDADIIGVLLDHHADLDSADEDGETALHLAIRRGYWDVAHRILDAHANVTMHNSEGVAAIHLAILVNQRDLVLRMLKEGANPNAADNTLTTCLMMAARTGALGLVYILMEHGAEVLLIDAERRTALDFAKMEGYQPIVDVLLHYHPGKIFTIIPIVEHSVFKEAMKSLGLEIKAITEKEQKVETPEEEKPIETSTSLEKEQKQTENVKKEQKQSESVDKEQKQSESVETEPLDDVESNPEFLPCNFVDDNVELKGFCGKVKKDIKNLYKEVDDFQTKVGPRIAKSQRIEKAAGKDDERKTSDASPSQVKTDEEFVTINLYNADDKTTAFCEKVKSDLKLLWTQIDHFEKEVARRHLANRPSTTVILHEKPVKGADLLAQVDDIRNVVQKFKIQVKEKE